ncbi:MAG: hypothetical protein ABUS49_03000, partial [Acidobacteriota bacterium]
LWQVNADAGGLNHRTPIPDYGFKAGGSYQGRRGFSASLFDVSDGPLNRGVVTLNPAATGRNLLNGNLRYDLDRHLPVRAKYGAALVVHADNLLDHAVWVPDWEFRSTDTVPAQQGRVIYIGLEFSAGKN